MSCDGIFCISKLTYGIVNNTIKKVNDEKKPYISYVPHGINYNIFKPIKNISENIKDLIYKEKEYNFILFFNNRNIKRKQPSDIILGYKLFCDSINKEKSNKCLLLMHTSAIDDNGTDLTAVIKDLCPNYDVKFLSDKLEQERLNELYNISDCTINMSNNEGFGLATAESLMSGTPIIVNVTGGLQDQCGFNYTENDYINIGSLHDKKKYGLTTHGEWVVPIWPDSNNLNGSVPTPYIYEDRVNIQEIASAIKKVYGWSKKERKRRGLIGREWGIKNLSNKIMSDKMIESIETTLNNWKPKKRFNLYRII